MTIFPRQFVRDTAVERLQALTEEHSQRLDEQIREIQANLRQLSQPPTVPSLDQPGYLQEYLAEPVQEEEIAGARMGTAAPLGTEPSRIGQLPFSATASENLGQLAPQQSSIGDIETPGLEEEPIGGSTIDLDQMMQSIAQEEADYERQITAMNQPAPMVQTGPGSSNVRRWAPLIEEASQKYNVPASVIAGTMQHESGGSQFREDGSPVRSPAGAVGLMQVIQSFHEREGEDLANNPRDNVMAGTRFLAELYRKHGSWDKAVAGYFGALDANGNITEASDGNTTGSGYVQSFNKSRSEYLDLDQTGIGRVFNQAGEFIQSKAGDLKRIFEGSLTPDQLNLRNWAEAVAACGPAAAYAWLARAGGVPDLEQIKNIAAAKGLWTTA